LQAKGIDVPETTANSVDYKTRYPDSLALDANLAVNFLMDVASGGPVTVATISVNGHPRAITFDTSSEADVEEMRSFLRFEETQPHNVFFVPNKANGREGGRIVPQNDDIVEIREIILDFDPDKTKPLEDERMRLRAVAYKLINGPVQPRSVIDSGGGMQVRYKLLEPIPLPHDNHKHLSDENEKLMRRLARALGADTATCTTKNLFRVPGTQNWPTPAKKKAGRGVSISGLWFTGGPATTLEELRSLCLTQPEEIDASKDQEIDLDGVTEAALIEVLGAPDRLPGRLHELVRSKPALVEAVRKPNRHLLDTSGQDHALLTTLARHQLKPGDMALLLAAYGAKVHKAHYEEHRLFSYVRTSVRKAWAEVNGAIEMLDPESFDEEQAAKDREQTEAKAQARHDRLRPIPLSEFLSEDDEYQMPLIQGLMGRQEMAVVYGESGAGKTFVTLDLSYRVSLGMLWCGRKTAQCAVVYIAAESPRGVKRRLKALSDTYGESKAFFVIRSSVNLFDPKADLDSLGKQIAALRVDVGLIVVDTLARTMVGGNENSTEDMSQLIANGDMLRDAFKANVLWVHHCGKDRSLGARGSSALRAATDTEIEVHDSWFDVTKLRDDAAFKRKFELKGGLVVGTSSDGSPVTTCIVHWPDGPTIIDSDKPDPAKGSPREKILYILRASGKPMTIGDIHATAQDSELRLGYESIRGLLNRSVNDETQRVFKKMGEISGPTGKVIYLYGLYDW
jgi:hypothetical protein